MNRAARYEHQFVRSFPDSLENGVLYVSVDFSNTAHRCMCGCGQEVYAQLTPRDWSMLFDGETVSLRPSIGNWSFPCRSHYVLRGGIVNWANEWTKEEVERGRARDRHVKAEHYAPAATESSANHVKPTGFFSRLSRWFSR